MKKRKQMITPLIFLLSITFLLMTSYKNNHKDPLDRFKTVSHYKQEKQNRYEDYQRQNPNLSTEEIVTHVNIGIDQAPYTNTMQTPFLNKIYLLTNKYLYLPENYIPNELERVDDTYTNGNKQLVKEAKIAFEQMAYDAKKEGYTIRVVSAYRSYSYQQVLYQNYVLKDGIEKADTYSARPGFSEHQTGLVIDVDNKEKDFNHFELTEEFTWMKKNASKYGFILRYPKGKEKITGYNYEAWHYRYVGKKIAQDIVQKDITLDEYYVKYIENN